MIPDRHSERSAFRPRLMLALSVAMCISTVTYTAYAAPPQAITLQGTILTPSGLPLETASVGFTVEIRSPGAENCLLYRETHTLNMTNSGGAFSLPIGTGVRAGGGFQETSTLSAVFDNDSADITGLTCQTGSNYDPASGDTRKVSITFDDGTGPQNLNQTLSVQSVPFALHSQSTNTLGPYGALDFLVLNPLSGLTQTNLDLVFASNANVTELLALINGTSTLFAKSAGAQTFSGAVTLSSPGTALSVTNNAFIGGTTTIGGVTSITNTTASTSSTTGALTINGGIGVAENLNAGGAVNAATTMSAGTSLMTPIIYGSSAASGTLTLQSTSNATKGNILMNPDGGNVGVGTTAPSAALDVRKTTTATAGQNYGSSSQLLVNVNGSGSSYYGSAGVSAFAGTGTIADSAGTYSGAMNSSSGTVTNASAVLGNTMNSGVGTITNAYGGNFTIWNTGGGTITNAYGVYVGAVPGTNRWSFYASDSNANNYFAGNVGIGTTGPADKLHVAGDIRVGTGTTGCVKDADGTVIAGTCSSDVRFKTDIEPLGSRLEQVSQLRPVTYKWRSEEFPDKHFGHETETGLIAQEVQQAIPELVAEDEEGYLKVRFTELNIYILQAVKDLYNRILGIEDHQATQDRRIANVEEAKADKAEMEAQLKAKDQKIRNLEQENAEMKARLDKIEKMLNSK